MPSRRYHAETVGRGEIIFFLKFYRSLNFLHVNSYPSDYLVHFKLLLFLYLQGLTLLELAAHLVGKATQWRCEGLGKIKIALAGTDTSSVRNSGGEFWS